MPIPMPILVHPWRRAIYTILFLGLILACRTPAHAAAPAAPPPPAAEPAPVYPAPVHPAPPAAPLFDDPAGTASASVAQVLPNGTTAQMLFTRVTRVELHAQVFAVHWGGGALTLLPVAYVGSLTINRHTAATEPAPPRAAP